jgi:hypothetical protein
LDPTSIAPAVAVTMVRVVPAVVYVPANPGNVTVLPTFSAPADTAETVSAVPELVAVPAKLIENCELTLSPATLAVYAPAVADTVPLNAERIVFLIPPTATRVPLS